MAILPVACASINTPSAAGRISLLRGWRKSGARNLEWKEIDLRGRTARLKAEDSKNGEPSVFRYRGGCRKSSQTEQRLGGSTVRSFFILTEKRSAMFARHRRARVLRPVSGSSLKVNGARERK
jgi:hypothetical protein